MPSSPRATKSSTPATPPGSTTHPLAPRCAPSPRTALPTGPHPPATPSAAPATRTHAGPPMSEAIRHRRAEPRPPVEAIAERRRLHPDDIRAIARLVTLEIEHLVAAPPCTAGALVDAAQLATTLGVSRAFVYEHADALGGVRLGTGRKARFRFDIERGEAVARLRDNRQSWRMNRLLIQESARLAAMREWAATPTCCPLGAKDAPREATAIANANARTVCSTQIAECPGGARTPRGVATGGKS